MRKDLEKASDESLAKEILKDPENLSFLIDRYWQQLFFFVKRISYFSSEDTEDILQDVFIKVYRNINSFDSSYKFSTWIFQITRNTTIDAIRKKTSRPQEFSLDQNDLRQILVESGIDIEEKIINKEKIKIIEKTIRALPFKYQEVMILKFLEEKTYEEMVDIIKKPKGTVASLLNRGKALFKKEAFKKGLVLED
jgi:RNA polymerase sigma-70 factor (ECF subfamily)